MSIKTFNNILDTISLEYNSLKKDNLENLDNPNIDIEFLLNKLKAKIFQADNNNRLYCSILDKYERKIKKLNEKNIERAISKNVKEK